MNAYNTISNINFFKDRNFSNLTINRSHHQGNVKYSKNKQLYKKPKQKSISLKYQSINFNTIDFNSTFRKNYTNFDIENDIGIKSSGKMKMKTALNYNNLNKYNNNYYSNRRKELEELNKTFEKEKTNNINYNKSNGKTKMKRTIYTSFSFNNEIHTINNDWKSISLYHFNKKNKSKINGKFKMNRFNGFDFNKLRKSGIKYCIDEEGNPMDIIDIKLKNKEPIAFIIPNKEQNLLVNLDNKIISPNKKGDYNFPNKPNCIIQKFDVQNPELRVGNTRDINSNKLEEEKNTRIIGESNEDINNESINKKNDKFKEEKNRSNLGGLQKNSQENFNTNFKINDKLKQIRVISPDKNLSKNNFLIYKNNLKVKKRKYIFVNKLKESSNRIELNLKNTTNNFAITKKNKDNTQRNEHNLFLPKQSNTLKQLINKLSKFKSRTSKLKDIKCFTQNDVKNLEFKFERKYKNIFENNIYQKYETQNNFYKNEVTPRDKDGEIQNNHQINKDNLISSIKKDNFIEVLDKSDFKNITEICKDNNKTKKIKKNNNNYNKYNTLTTFNNSPPTEHTTLQTTIKDLQKKFNKAQKVIDSKLLQEKKNNNFSRPYLSPKNEYMHKRVKTEVFNTIENKENININVDEIESIIPLNYKESRLIQVNDAELQLNECPYCKNII